MNTSNHASKPQHSQIKDEATKLGYAELVATDHIPYSLFLHRNPQGTSAAAASRRQESDRGRGFFVATARKASRDKSIAIQYRRTGRDARIHVKAVACVVVHVPYIRSIDRDPPEIDRRWRRRPIDRHRIRG